MIRLDQLKTVMASPVQLVPRALPVPQVQALALAPPQERQVLRLTLPALTRPPSSCSGRRSWSKSSGLWPLPWPSFRCSIRSSPRRNRRISWRRVRGAHSRRIERSHQAELRPEPILFSSLHHPFDVKFRHQYRHEYSKKRVIPKEGGGNAFMTNLRESHESRIYDFPDPKPGNDGCRFSRSAFTPSARSGEKNPNISSASDASNAGPAARNQLFSERLVKRIAC